MRSWLRVICASLLLAGGLVASPAMAQETGITGDIERYASSSPQEKIDYAATSNEEIREIIKAVAKMVEDARRENAVEQLQCVNSKLIAIRSLQQVSEAAESAMNTALGEGNVERADHEFRKIAVALSKSRALRAEAERCGLDSGMESGDTIIDVEGGDDAEVDELREDVFEGDIDFDPPEASPFQ